MTTRKHTLWALALLVGAAGCDSATGPVDAADTPQADLNAELASITAAAAAALGDPATAAWVHDETMEQFDGETNVLWTSLNADAPAGKADLGPLP